MCRLIPRALHRIAYRRLMLGLCSRCHIAVLLACRLELLLQLLVPSKLLRVPRFRLFLCPRRCVKPCLCCLG